MHVYYGFKNHINKCQVHYGLRPKVTKKMASEENLLSSSRPRKDRVNGLIKNDFGSKHYISR